MEITKNNIDALNATIKITVTKEDYQPGVDSALKDIQKKAVFKGFRPGKAPLGLVKKEFNARAKADEINKIVSKALSDYLKDNKIDYMGEPLPSEQQSDVVFDYNKDENFDFYVDIALTPEFDADIDNTLSLKQYEIKIEDSAIDKAVEQYKNAAGRHEKAEVSSEKSLLKGEVFQVDNSGARVDSGLSNRTSMLVEMVKDEEQKKRFIGKKSGDEITFDLTQVFPNEKEAKALLNNQMIDFKTMNVNFAFKIEEISDFVQGELTQEVFDRFFPKDTVHNLEEMIVQVREQFKDGYENESDIKLLIDAKKALLENIKFDVPVKMMKRWLLTLDEYKNLTQEDLETRFPRLEDDIRWNLIESKLVKKNNIEISEDEELQAAKDITLQEFARYGLMPSQVPDDMLDNFAKERLAKNQDRGMIRSQVISQKLTEIIKEKATLTKEEISYEDFTKLFE